MLSRLTNANKSLRTAVADDLASMQMTCKIYFNHLLKDFPSFAIELYAVNPKRKPRRTFMVNGLLFSKHEIDADKLLADTKLESFYENSRKVLKKIQWLLKIKILLETKKESLVYKVLVLNDLVKNTGFEKDLMQSRGLIFTKPAAETDGAKFFESLSVLVNSMCKSAISWRDQLDDNEVLEAMKLPDYLNTAAKKEENQSQFKYSQSDSGSSSITAQSSRATVTVTAQPNSLTR